MKKIVLRRTEYHQRLRKELGSGLWDHSQKQGHIFYLINRADELKNDQALRHYQRQQEDAAWAIRNITGFNGMDFRTY